MKVPYNKRFSFEWDELKNYINIIKHNVSFEESQETFLDLNRLVLVDKEHSTKTEKRYYCVGMIRNRICTVRYSKRKGKIRIFGAGYWRKEARQYEKINKK